MTNEIKDLRLAVLIDADNVPRNSMKAIMEEAAIYGTPTIKRIYGDWTSPNVGAWKSLLLENAVTPIQQYSYTTGKNSTDSAMIIDAMDILYEGKTDGFCIVSSDSDFTRLVARLREDIGRIAVVRDVRIQHLAGQSLVQTDLAALVHSGGIAVAGAEAEAHGLPCGKHRRWEVRLNKGLLISLQIIEDQTALAGNQDPAAKGRIAVGGAGVKADFSVILSILETHIAEKADKTVGIEQLGKKQGSRKDHHGQDDRDD